MTKLRLRSHMYVAFIFLIVDCASQLADQRSIRIEGTASLINAWTVLTRLQGMWEYDLREYYSEINTAANRLSIMLQAHPDQTNMSSDLVKLLNAKETVYRYMRLIRSSKAVNFLRVSTQTKAT